MSKLHDAKIAAVEQLIKSISPNLSEETRSELARKILNEIWKVFLIKVKCRRLINFVMNVRY